MVLYSSATGETKYFSGFSKMSKDQTNFSRYGPDIKQMFLGCKRLFLTCYKDQISWCFQTGNPRHKRVKRHCMTGSQAKFGFRPECITDNPTGEMQLGQIVTQDGLKGKTFKHGTGMAFTEFGHQGRRREARFLDFVSSKVCST